MESDSTKTRLTRLPCWWGGGGGANVEGQPTLFFFTVSGLIPPMVPGLAVMTKEFCISEHQRVASVWNSVHLYCTRYDVDGTRGNPNSRGTQVPLERHALSFFFNAHVWWSSVAWTVQSGHSVHINYVVFCFFKADSNFSSYLPLTRLDCSIKAIEQRFEMAMQFFFLR